MNELDIHGETNLQVTLRDNDTGVEVTSSISVLTANQRDARKILVKGFKDTLDRLWPMEDDDGRQKDS